ncbi:MAG: OadG family transporter subunit [Gammaproteobacteria bacterium]
MNQMQLLNQSFDLMLIGMTTVFTFLILLVLLMMIITKFAADSENKSLIKDKTESSLNELNQTHKKIIKQLFEYIR